MKDRVVTENYKKLTDEQKHALEIDIFKPLDFDEIFNRMKNKESIENTNASSEQSAGTETTEDQAVIGTVTTAPAIAERRFTVSD